MENFGKKLKDLRKAAGISQKEFAKMINITPPNLSQWESMATPPLEGIIKICNELNIPLWEFFIENESDMKELLPQWITPEQIDFLKKLNNLPEDISKQMLENFTGILSLRKML